MPGAGQPLDTEPWQGGEWAVAYHVLKQAGETLHWIALGRDIDTARARLRSMLREVPKIAPAELERARQRYLEEAAALDEMLVEYAFIVPIRQLERGRLPPHIAAEQFDAARRGESSSAAPRQPDIT